MLTPVEQPFFRYSMWYWHQRRDRPLIGTIWSGTEKVMAGRCTLVVRFFLGQNGWHIECSMSWNKIGYDHVSSLTNNFSECFLTLLSSALSFMLHTSVFFVTPAVLFINWIKPNRTFFVKKNKNFFQPDGLCFHVRHLKNGKRYLA